jgi:hypothetical protein
MVTNNILLTRGQKIVEPSDYCAEHAFTSDFWHAFADAFFEWFDIHDSQKSLLMSLIAGAIGDGFM